MNAELSRPVSSSQAGPHRRLTETVQRHWREPWRKPMARHTQQAFAALRELLGPAPGALVLDSGCGTGRSTLRLAERHPSCLVLGVDQSASRLRRQGVEGLARFGNAVLLQAELADFWRLAASAGWRLQHHYLLYPNPWPKPAQLQRRWHGHPVFPTLLELGGTLELRSNWRLYLEEFALALVVAGHEAPKLERLKPDACLTPFEEKYARSGHDLWRLVHVPADRSPGLGDPLALK